MPSRIMGSKSLDKAPQALKSYECKESVAWLLKNTPTIGADFLKVTIPQLS